MKVGAGRALSALLWVVVILCARGISSSRAPSAFFARCDHNGDGQWTLREFQSCFQHSPEMKKSEELMRSDVEGLFDIMDADRNRLVSEGEYAAMQAAMARQRVMTSATQSAQDSSTVNDKDEIIVRTRDGKEKVYSRSEFFESNAKQHPLEGFHRTNNDQLLREDEKTSTVDEVAKSDPALSRVIRIAQWSVQQLQSQNVLSQKARLQRMTSVPHTATGERVTDEELVRRRDDFDYESIRLDVRNNRYFQIHLQLYLEDDGRSRVIEVSVEVDPSASQQLYMLSANEIGADGRNELWKQDARPRSPAKAVARRPYVTLFGRSIPLNALGYVTTMILCFVGGFFYMSRAVSNRDRRDESAKND